MSEVLKRFGVSAVFGFVFGVVLSIWVSPTTSGGVGFVIVMGMCLVIIVVEVIRIIVAIARPQNPPRD